MRSPISWLLILIFGAYLATNARAETEKQVRPTGPCMDRVTAIAADLRVAWQIAAFEQPSAARDTIWSAEDYAGVYRDLMVRIPGKFDRTKGAYYELADRVNYMWRIGRSYPWRERRMYGVLAAITRNTAYLGDCYRAE